MTFWKTVFPKSANLLEYSFRKFFRQTLGPHAVDQLGAKLVNHPWPSPGCHRTAQLVGFAWREAGGDDCQPHCLFLKQEYAKGLLQHLSDLIVRINDISILIAPTQIGMHHISLNRPRPDDGHLDHQVVKLIRL